MKSILTGSRVYGEPRPDSDLDMVVLCETPEDRVRMMTVRTHKTPPIHMPRKRDFGYAGVSLRYDNLNVILVDDPAVFEAWEKGTEFLKAIAPVTHDQACTVFETMFKIAQERKPKIEIPF